ncbi:hypothetical protein SUGI_0976290 [Cryptomeria japonica]|nr:hypothetical protein SUGI_0976290 [Cryptomeria japonica]
MELDDYELNLQTEIVRWKCSRYADCNMKFIRKPRHMKLGMKGLVWSIQALKLQSPTEYAFNIMEVKRWETPEAAAPNLPAKFELLLAGYKASMKSVRRVDEALDKLYAFSHLFSLAQKDGRWWIVVDAQIIARACEYAKEALYQAAEAAAAILVDQVKSPVLIRGQPKEVLYQAAEAASAILVDQVKSLVLMGGQQSKSCERSGWWIDRWTVADELWATSFFPRDNWKWRMREFQAKGVEGGNVFQWCTVRVFYEPNPNFQFEVAVQEFLDGDDVLLRIGVANDRPLTVRVFLTESVKVVCSQEGLETGTSLGLGYLLPETVREYIRSALRRKEAEVSDKNVVQGLLGHLIRYLTFLGKICVICGRDRLVEVPQSSTCRDICKATKQRYEDAIARILPDQKISEEERAKRREQYVKKLYKNSTEGCRWLGNLVYKVVVDEAKIGKHRNDVAINYEKAVGRVSKMKSRRVALALQISISELWIDDSESF